MTHAPRPDGWPNGWPRISGMVLMGTCLRCAGCGADRGTTCVVIRDDWQPPAREPDWPFPPDDCPVCVAFREAPPGPPEWPKTATAAYRLGFEKGRQAAAAALAALDERWQRAVGQPLEQAEEEAASLTPPGPTP